MYAVLPKQLIQMISYMFGACPKWMSLYEKMVCEFATVLATNEEMVAHMKIAGWESPIYNISGLAFGKQEVQERLGERIKPFHERANRICFSARFDQEKQPDFFMDLVERYSSQYPNQQTFAILQGGPLRSNNEKYITRARELEARGILRDTRKLTKA